jgi:hypothetical protein
MTKLCQNKKHVPVNKVCIGSEISNLHTPDMDTARIFTKGVGGSQNKLAYELIFHVYADTSFNQCPVRRE